MVATYAAPISASYSEQLTNTEVPANNGTRHPIALRHGFDSLVYEPAAACRVHLVPAITNLYFYDASEPMGSRWKNLLDKDRSLINRHVAGDSQGYLNAMTANDYLYIGTRRRVGGYRLDMDSALVNAVATTLTGAYSSQWGFVTTAITDGTASGGATLAQDGNITIDSVPATWGAYPLSKYMNRNVLRGTAGEQCFWFRLSVDATLTAGVEIEKVVPMAEVAAGTITSDSQSVISKASVEYVLSLDDSKTGALEFIAQGGAATTANLSWLKRGG